MTQGTCKLFIVIITGMAALALGAGAIRPGPARAAGSALVRQQPIGVLSCQDVVCQRLAAAV